MIELVGCRTLSDNAPYKYCTQIKCGETYKTMIELVSASRCIKCNICVSACPTNVFDKVLNAPPTIARKSDCQTCYICELYCPVDALFVAPQADESVIVDEQTLIESGLLGTYRQRLGWGRGRTPAAQVEESAKFFKYAP